MESYLLIILAVLVVLAVIDLMVGVSNDAVNFLNSAIGSKAIPYKTIMIVASLGILCGAVFSSGMMEIARSGIFVPEKFSFQEVMIIFVAVMVTDVILLDIFNFFGLPTSTTVSIVFELLGAAVSLTLYKIYDGGLSWGLISTYINTEKASEIVVSILLSVAVSFSLGMIIQYICRLAFTFKFQRKTKKFGPIFGGIALAAISYFILIKGLKTVTFISTDVKAWIHEYELVLVACTFVLMTIISFIITRTNASIFKVIIIVGTFALALSFAGNDLVNFIGVPVAAYQSIGIFHAAGEGVGATTFMMGDLANDNIAAPVWILIVAGVIMVFTLWTSSKAKNVIETEMSLSSQSSNEEKFSANFLSKNIVRFFITIGHGLNFILPRTLQTRLDKQFENPQLPLSTKKTPDEPMFDMVRASVNLMVASILIALGTSMKLPLSTTYVTFMVAMGSAFADRAWDRETAVYRVSGVFHVIGGWFITAACAFSGAFIIAYLLTIGEEIALFSILIFMGILLYRNAKSHSKKKKEKELLKLKIESTDIQTLQEVTEASAEQISEIVTKTNVLYKEVIESLINQDLNSSNTARKLVKKLQNELNSTNSSLYDFIRNLDENSVKGIRYYIQSLGYLQDIVENLGVITANIHTHLDNNHKSLKVNQAKDLKYNAAKLSDWYSKINDVYKRLDFSKIDIIINERIAFQDTINEMLDAQIDRIRTSESSPKNTKLYFSILLETNELISSTFKLLRLHKEFENFRNGRTPK
ncbi:MAG: inorganic phosphate transporter [Sphingobacterium sp.]